MTNDIEKTRPAFEAAVIERLKESGFLEVEIRVECLKPRVGDGYQDEVINAGWHYWKAGIAATTPQVLYVSDEIQADDIQELLKQYPETIIVARKEPTASEILNKLAEVSAAVGFGAGEPATEIAGHFVSFLAANPVHIERFMRDGHEMVIDGTFTYDQGNLTYRAVDGTIRHPDDLKADNAEKDREIGQLKAALGADAAQFMQSLVDECSREIEKRKALEAKLAAVERALTLPDAERRLFFISELLAKRGYFNRADLCSTFGISVPQASIDIRKWMAANNGEAFYNKATKRYEGGDCPASEDAK